MMKWLTLNFLDAYRDVGLLLTRAGVGLSFAYFHGWGKITGGPEMWDGIGGAMARLGVTFFPMFWGLMASLAEFAGGILLAVGFLTRPAAAMLAFTMLVAALHHAGANEDFSRPLEMLFVFAGLFLAGGGRLSVDAKV